MKFGCKEHGHTICSYDDLASKAPNLNISLIFVLSSTEFVQLKFRAKNAELIFGQKRLEMYQGTLLKRVTNARSRKRCTWYA